MPKVFTIHELSQSDVAQVLRFDRLCERRINELQRRALVNEVSWAGMLVLRELAAVHGGRSAAWLLGKMDFDRGYLSRVLKELCARGLAQREMSSLDRRLQEYELTADGLELAHWIDDFLGIQALHMLDLMAPRARRRLIRAMRTVEDLLTRHLLPEFAAPWSGPLRKRARYRPRRCVDSPCREPDLQPG